MLLILLALMSYETTYTDASGSKCTAFAVGPQEVDVCHGRFDREGLGMPPVQPIAVGDAK